MKILHALFGLQILQVVVVAQGLGKGVYENYSFDFSGGKRPIAYSSIGNTVELQSKIKLNPAVANNGGAYILLKPIEVKEVEFDIEFTI